MLPSKPDLIVLPFKAVLAGTSIPLTLEQTLSLLKGERRRFVQIERTYPGASETIGWTIFRRTTKKYLHETAPLFRFERGARRYIRKAHAIYYARLTSDDGMTHSYLDL
jgi:hypothetical protein